MNYRIERLRYQLREDPSSRVFLRLAELLQADGQAGEAVAVLSAGLEHHPRSAAAWVALGRGLREQADGDGAARAFARAHALDPAHPLAARAVAESAAAAADWPAAAAALSRVRPLAAGDPELAACIAEVDGRIAELEAAAERERLRLVEEEARLAEEEARRAEQEAAEAAARRVRAAWRARPPSDVVRLGDGDPFGELTAAGIAIGEGAGDVFALREELPPAEAPPPVVDETVVEALREAAPESHGEPEPESWADVATEVAAVPEPEPGELIESMPAIEPIAVEDLAELFEGAEGVVPQVETLDEIFERTPPPGLEDAARLVARVEVTPLPEAVPEGPGELAPESWADLAAELGAEPDVVAAAAPEEAAPSVEPEPLELVAEAAIEPRPPLAHEPSPAREADEGPLPTLTLARLAAHQGAWGLAVTTLQRLLEREPGNLEASSYLAELQGEASSPEGAVRGSAPAKVAALRAWLDTVRLGSERHGA